MTSQISSMGMDRKTRGGWKGEEREGSNVRKKKKGRRNCLQQARG